MPAVHGPELEYRASNMADLTKMNRTWLCSVVFMDIVNYSSQSVELQMKWKQRFNGYLAEAIQDVPESERVILDTGDGAAICFLGAPEAAMFAALELWHFLLLDEREQQPQLRVRIGINLGPVRLVKDINGAQNAIGDGMNAGQRVMSFAAENQILVSQSYFEVVSRLSDDYKTLFTLKGIETDKHIREHTVYKLSPPGAEQSQASVSPQSLTPQQAAPVPAAISQRPPTPPERIARTVPESRPENKVRARSRSIPLLVCGIALVLVAAVGAWRFFGSAAPSNPKMNPPPGGQAQISGANPATAPAAAAPSASSAPVSPPDIATSANKSPHELKSSPRAGRISQETVVSAPSNPTAKQAKASAPVASVAEEAAAPPPEPARPVLAAGVAQGAQAAFDDGMRLLDEDDSAQALRRFDDAIRAQPDFIDAYVERAEARRRLVQYELSLEDCNKIIQLKPEEPRGYNCRGFGRQLLKQYEASLPDFSEAIRRNPNFALAYGNRGTTYNLLQQYDRALQDFNEAIRLMPRNPPLYIKRGNAYSNLKQYDDAIRDYTTAIRLKPDNMNAYRLRAMAEEASGDAAGAASDRAHLRESGKRGNK
jgi:class 3 adenylate cyclase/Tfp pilus assembly protein PilF